MVPCLATTSALFSAQHGNRTPPVNRHACQRTLMLVGFKRLDHRQFMRDESCSGSCDVMRAKCRMTAISRRQERGLGRA